MKLLAPVILTVAVLTGAGGSGPLKDSLAGVVAWHDDGARMRAEIAELRSGRGSAAPDWLALYAKAICSMDPSYVAQHTDESLGMTGEEIAAQFQRMQANGLDCSGVRYLGSVGEHSFVFVLHQGAKDVWYVLTTSDEADTVVKVE